MRSFPGRPFRSLAHGKSLFLWQSGRFGMPGIPAWEMSDERKNRGFKRGTRGGGAAKTPSIQKLKVPFPVLFHGEDRISYGGDSPVLTGINVKHSHISLLAHHDIEQSQVAL